MSDYTSIPLNSTLTALYIATTLSSISRDMYSLTMMVALDTQRFTELPVHGLWRTIWDDQKNDTTRGNAAVL